MLRLARLVPPLAAAALLASACAGDPPAASDEGAIRAAGAGGEVGVGVGGGDDGRGGAGGSSVTEKCGCFLGDGAYCGARAVALAEKEGCTLEAAKGHKGDLLKCDTGKWSVLDECPGTCDYDPKSPKLDDACELPECDCFVEVAWCGSGAAKEAKAMKCQIPLLPKHQGDILYCPGGEWAVKQNCEKGCIEEPKGTPDSCKSESDYHVPYSCGTTRSCTNGNHTNTHTGNDEYAYDFGMPVGTLVRAMRSGKVLHVRNVSQPGDKCYNSGDSSCANFANTVEVLHSDGTVALYMHLSKGLVKAGDPIAQGDIVGKSGNSGWSTGPHTHVQVQQNCGIWWCQSIPFKFVEDSTVSAGTSVKSENCP